MALTYLNKLGKLLVARVSESDFHFSQQLHFEIYKRISLNTGQIGRLDENIRISQNIQGPKSITEQTRVILLFAHIPHSKQDGKGNLRQYKSVAPGEGGYSCLSKVNQSGKRL